MSSLNCSEEYRQYVEKCLVGENLVHEIEGKIPICHECNTIFIISSALLILTASLQTI